LQGARGSKKENIIGCLTIKMATGIGTAKCIVATTAISKNITSKPTSNQSSHFSVKKLFYFAISLLIAVSFYLGNLARSHLISRTATRFDSCETASAAFISQARHVEHIEKLVHPAMLAHPHPSSVLVIGGTQGDDFVKAILVELSRYKKVPEVRVVRSISARRSRSQSHQPPFFTMENICVKYSDSLEELLELYQPPLLENLTSQKQKPFDVVFLLHPYILLSNIDAHHLKNHYIMNLSDYELSILLTLTEDHFMAKNGIIATYLGPSPYSRRKSKLQLQGNCSSMRCEENLQLKLIHDIFRDKQINDIHVYEDSNGSGAESYAIFCKDTNCRQNWFAEEAFISFLIRKRLSSPPLYLDGGTLKRYTRPHKAWQSLYCSFPENSRECSYIDGFDPDILNIGREAFEVKPSSIGEHVGRGIFTKVDIPEGSYIMQEVAVHQVKFSVQSTAIALKAKLLLLKLFQDAVVENMFDYGLQLEVQNHKYEIDSILAYMEGYGYDDDCIYGSSGNFVDSGYNTFMNHGCNKTFNFGTIFWVYDKKAGVSQSEYEYLMLSEEEADVDVPAFEVAKKKTFNPLIDRHLEHMLSSYEGTIFNISKGQELFSNYVHYWGEQEWKVGIEQLRSQCRGESVGMVVKVEGKSTV
jgi:hypothetical protein